jgi:hypothetical protein
VTERTLPDEIEALARRAEAPGHPLRAIIDRSYRYMKKRDDGAGWEGAEGLVREAFRLGLSALRAAEERGRGEGREEAAKAVDYLAAHTSREDEEQRVMLDTYANAANRIRALTAPAPSPETPACSEPGCILGRHDDPDSSHWNGKRGWCAPETPAPSGEPRPLCRSAWDGERCCLPAGHAHWHESHDAHGLRGKWTDAAAAPAKEEHTPNLANGVCTKCLVQATNDGRRWQYESWRCLAPAKEDGR